MAHNYHWFYHRLRSMSVPEVFYRVGQFIQNQSDRRQMGWQPSVRLARLPEPLLPFDPAGTSPVSFSAKQPVFRHTIDINEPVDWHLDVGTGRRFPITYAKDVDVRSGRGGSAKYVWEINRLLFLPQLAIQYRQAEADRNTELARHYLTQFVNLNRSWFRANPYLTGVNWYSNIEVNIRLINWFISWNILDASALARVDNNFRAFVEAEWLPVIYQHCVYSRSHPSRHSSANNHLIAEYTGLFVAASFWAFPESAAWQAYAKAGLERELENQHSPNGINREEAAEYIQFITDFFLIAQVVGERSGEPFSTGYKAKLKQIFGYIAQFLDGWGTFPRYGDEDDGRVLLLDDDHRPNNFESLLRSGAVLFGEPFFKQRSANGGNEHRFDLKNYVLFGAAGRTAFEAVPATNEPLGSVFFDEGHFIFRKQKPGNDPSQLREIYVHANAAPLGFLSIAAHGHADALSFLMHVDGQVMLADPGTYSYQTDPEWRNYFISTRAHNTVCIDGQNQAFQAGALLWLDHYTASVLSARSDGQVDEVVATHNGYDGLHCRHERTFRFEKPDDRLVLTDVVENYGEQARLIEVLFHAGPNVRVAPLNGALPGSTEFALVHPGTPRRVRLKVASSLQTEVVTGQTGQEGAPSARLGWYSEGFYHRQAVSTIRAHLILDPGRMITLCHRLEVQPPTEPYPIGATEAVGHSPLNRH